MRDNFIIFANRVKAHFDLRMGKYTWESFTKTSQMEKGSIIGKMEIIIKETLWMGFGMDMGLWKVIMELNMLVNLEMIKNAD